MKIRRAAAKIRRAAAEAANAALRLVHRRPVAAAVMTVLAASLAVPVLVSDGGPFRGGANDEDVPVAVAVLQALTEDGAADFWVDFEDRADLSEAKGIKDWGKRGRYVYDHLTATAKASQADLLAKLKAQGVEAPVVLDQQHRARAQRRRGQRWNGPATGLGRGGSGRLARPAPNRSRVPSARRRGPARSSGASPTSTPTTSGTSSATSGEGIVVASIDTGVQYDHPALVEAVPRQQRRRHVRPQLQLVRPVRASCAGDARATTTATAPTRWARWSATTAGAQPDRRRAAARSGSPPRAASLDCSDDGAALVRPVDARADRPGRQQPATRQAPEHRQQLVGRRPANDPFYAGRSSRPGPRPGSSRCSRTATPDPAATPRLAGRLRRVLRVGAYDINNNIADFSGRGPGQDGEIKPDIVRARRRTSARASPATATRASAARRWPRRTCRARSRCCGRRPRPGSATSTPPGHLLDATAVDTADAPVRRHARATTTCTARVVSTRWPC